jgi:hypothetical protein
VEAFPVPEAHQGRSSSRREGENYTINNRHFPNSLVGSTLNRTFNLTYALNGQYSLLTGYAASSHRNTNSTPTTVLAGIKFFGDGILLDEITFLKGEDAKPFSVDVTGVQSLFIETYKCDGSRLNNNDYVVIGTPRIQ